MITALVVAAEGGRVTPGVLGFLVVALLGLATYLLIRSMNRQIRRIDLPEDRPDDSSGSEDAGREPATPPEDPGPVENGGGTARL